MSKPVLEDRPIWPVAPAEAPPEEGPPSRSGTDPGPAPEDDAQQVPLSTDSFEGFGSFSG